MDELIHAFGIDGRLIIIQMINFVVLAVALTYFLYTPLLNMLKSREEKIAQGILDAENAAKAKATAEQEKKAVLATAHEEADAINVRAKASADAKASEIAQIAQEKAAATVKAAELKAEDMKAQALKESEGEIAKLAILAAEKILKEKSS